MDPSSSSPGVARESFLVDGHGSGEEPCRDDAVAEPFVDVVVEDPRWHAAVPRVARLAEEAAVAALAEAGAPAGMITVLLTDDRAVKRLNGLHRGKNKPTNVLSFPAEMPGLLGDIAVALGVVRREARAAGRPMHAHLAHLVAHGALHLIGD